MPDKSILLDADGPLLDFVSQVSTTAFEVSGGRCVIRPSDVDRWDIFSLIDEPWRKEVRNVISTSAWWWTSLPRADGAAEGIWRIRGAGYRVVVVTSPWESNPTWESQRRAALLRGFGIRKEDIIPTSQKHFVRGLTLIDDKIDHVVEWARINKRPAWLYEMAHNAKVEWDWRFTWGRVGEMLSALEAG